MIVKPSTTQFKNNVLGYTIGMSVIFVPLFLILLVPSMAAQENIGLAKAIAILLMVPVIALFQGVIYSALVSLGLWLFSKVRRTQSS